MTEPTEPTDTLHLYAQQHWHDHAMVIGTRGALTQLREALTTALETDAATASQSFFATDGEGYDVHIVVESEGGMERLLLPYTTEIARDQREHCHWPQPPRRENRMWKPVDRLLTPAATPQPPPLPGATEVWPLVLEDIAARRAMGEAKYGVPLTVENGRDGLMDTLQELLDAVVYVKQAMLQRDRVNAQLAEAIRDLYRLHDPLVDDIAERIGMLMLKEM